MSDESRDLVRRGRDGDRAALEELLQKHLPGLRAFIRLRMGGRLRAREESADLAQSVCLAALRALDSFEYQGEAAFKDWLYTSAHRKLIDRSRRQQSMRRDPAREVPMAGGAAGDDALLACYHTLITPSRDAAAREQIARFEEAFSRLDEDHRELILLARIVGLPHREIAERMGRSEGAVRTALYRGLAKLSWLVEEE